jgi:hypothetical protein
LSGSSRRGLDGLLLALLWLGLLFLCTYFKDWNFDWVTIWYLWLIPLLCPPIFMLAGRSSRCSAGAQWLARGGGGWVRLYEINLIKVSLASAGTARQIELHDSCGHAMSIRVDDLQLNPKLWDLVYNGLIHSVHVNGAETNKRARDWLQLERPPTVAESWW